MGYTNKDFINAFLTYHKCRNLIPEQDDEQLDISPLLPFILADTGYNYYMKFVRPLKLKFDLQKCRKEMTRAYTDFNKDLFDAFADYDKKHNTGDDYESMADSFIEKMDNFLAAETDHLRVVRVAAMNTLPQTTDFKVLEVVAASMMFNHMAKCAQDIWGLIFANRKGDDAEHPALSRLMYKTKQFSTLYLKQYGVLDADVAEDKAQEIQTSVDVLYRHIVEWVVKDMKES